MLKASGLRVMMALVWLFNASMRERKDETISRHVVRPVYSAWWVEAIVASRGSNDRPCARLMAGRTERKSAWRHRLTVGNRIGMADWLLRQVESSLHQRTRPFIYTFEFNDLGIVNSYDIPWADGL